MLEGRRNSKGQTLEEFLDKYKPGDYERPSVTVDMLLFTVMDKENKDKRRLAEKQLKIMLVKRKDHPYIGQWAIPGGFVDINESLDEAARRELKEETNVDNIYMEQLYTWGDVKRDPRMRVISASYMALIPNKGIKPIAGDDAEDVQWFSVSRESINIDGVDNSWRMVLVNEDESIKIACDIEETFVMNGLVKEVERKFKPVYDDNYDSLAFDHALIIATGLERIANKIEYTPIAFNLVDEYFTLTEIQSVYELILNKKLIKPNFRRKIAPMLKETNVMRDDVRFRPAKCFKFNNDWTHEF